MEISKSHTRRQPQRDPSNFSSLVREISLWIVFSVGLYLVLALITYDPQDPGWSYAIPNISNTKNAGGLVGAWCADLLVYLFGYLAFLFPITILWHSL
ncbi:hypothetical protein TI05_19585, partial [Achromatium sp. WMS3]